MRRLNGRAEVEDLVMAHKINFCHLLLHFQCDKRDWSDDDYDEDHATNNYNKVRYNNRIPTARPTWRNNPYYMDRYNNRPTLRPTYRMYASGQYPTAQYTTYTPPTWQGDTYTTTTYTPPAWQGDTYPTPAPYDPYSVYTPPTWQGDAYTGDKGGGGGGNNGYKKYKTKKPSASPTVSFSPTTTQAPSPAPSVSMKPSVSMRPSVSRVIMYIAVRYIL